MDAIVDKRSVATELAVSFMLSSLARRAICPNFVLTRSVFTAAHGPCPHLWGSADCKHGKPGRVTIPKTPGQFQYIRMELCQEGDCEELLKRQPDTCVDPATAQALVFQIAFGLHAAADQFSVKHYDIKLLNIFMQRVESEGDLVLRYGLGCHMFRLRMLDKWIAKVADYGTANVDPTSTGQPVTIAQFTTIENTPPDFFLMGDKAQQGHGHDQFGLGLCMLHLFTGHRPYEEILDDVYCPPNLRKRLGAIWEVQKGFQVLQSVILSDVYKDEAGNILDGEPDETSYHTLYRFLVLFGVPDGFANNKVQKAIVQCLQGKGRRTDANRYQKDCRKYSLQAGSNRYIARARQSLQSMPGGMELLLHLCHFDPAQRATACQALNSPFFFNLREEVPHESRVDDTTYSYTAFSTAR